MNLLLSLIATAISVGAVTVTTQTLSESASVEARSVELISHHATMRLIARWAGYLVSHSLILCKEPNGTSSWTGEGERKCRWTPRVPSNFIGGSDADGYEDFYGFDDSSDNKKLIYKINPGDVDVDDLPFNKALNTDGEIYYKLSFDLVSYRDHEHLLKLVKDVRMPKCRSSLHPFDVVSGGVCNDPEDNTITCKNKNNLSARLDRTVCHYDKDNMFVLIEVSYHKKANNELVDKIFAGIKRPLAHTLVALNTDVSPVCQWACPANITTTEFMSCRGKWVYDTSYNTDAIPAVKVINKGPGALYKFLLKKELTGGSDIDVFSLQDPEIEVLMPGESLSLSHPNSKRLCELAASLSLLETQEAGADNICPSGYAGVEHFIHVEPARLFYPLKSMKMRSIATGNIDVMKANFTVNSDTHYAKVVNTNIQMGDNKKRVCFKSQ